MVLERGMTSKLKSLTSADYCPYLLYTPPAAPIDWVCRRVLRIASFGCREVVQVDSLREGIRRNKVSVGEPAEGSLSPFIHLGRLRPAGKNLKNFKKMKIFNGGYLGSHIEEERSELRYAM